MAVKLAKVTEKAFTKAVLEYSRLHSWRAVHFRPALTRTGRWVTAMMGEGVGFPDLLLLKGERQIVAELKVGRNRPSEAQLCWIQAFRSAGVATYIWYPEDWPEIEAVLGA